MPQKYTPGRFRKFLANIGGVSAALLLLLIITALTVTSYFSNWIFEVLGVVTAMVLWGSVAYMRFYKKR